MQRKISSTTSYAYLRICVFSKEITALAGKLLDIRKLETFLIIYKPRGALPGCKEYYGTNDGTTNNLVVYTVRNVLSNDI